MCEVNCIDFLIGKRLNSKELPFYALVTAAYLKADQPNKQRMKLAFPFVCEDIEKRNSKDMGLLESEKDYDINQIRRVVDSYIENKRSI